VKDTLSGEEITKELKLRQSRPDFEVPFGIARRDMGKEKAGRLGEGEKARNGGWSLVRPRAALRDMRRSRKKGTLKDHSHLRFESGQPQKVEVGKYGGREDGLTRMSRCRFYPKKKFSLNMQFITPPKKCQVIST